MAVVKICEVVRLPRSTSFSQCHNILHFGVKIQDWRIMKSFFQLTNDRLYYSKILRHVLKLKLSDWNIGIREAVSEPIYKINNANIEVFYPIPHVENYWFADPILFGYHGDTFLFVEAFNMLKKKGEIGLFEIINGEAVHYRTIIELACHMSYPFVFENNGDVYMIPESGNGNKLLLYKAEPFPYKWNEICCLIEGQYRDSTIYRYQDSIYLFTYKRTDHCRHFMHRYQCYLYKLDIEKQSLQLIEEYTDVNKELRPAGYVEKSGDTIIHATQKCDRIYGEAIIFWSKRMNTCSWKNAEKVKILSHENVIIKGKGKPITMHTYTTAGGYEVIDYRIPHKG